MNKARITYRFDTDGRRQEQRDKPPVRQAEQSKQREQTVIPLRAEDYRIDEREETEPVLTALTDLEDPEQEPPEKLAGGSYQRATAGRIRDDYYLDPMRTDHSAWKSSLAQEADRLERMIRQSGRVDAQWREEPDDASDMAGDAKLERAPMRWEDSDFEPESGYARTMRTPPRRRPTSWFRIVSSVGGAVATGVLFGYLALQLIHPDPNAQPVTDPSASAGGTLQVTGDTAGSTDSSSASAASGQAAAAGISGAVTVNLPAETYYLLQNGVFNSRDGADQAANALRKNGFAAADENEGQIAVFAGMSSDRSDALLLGQRLKDNGMDVYIKTYQVPATARIAWNGTSGAEAKAFLDGARGLIQTMNSLTVLHLKEDGPKAMDKSTVDQLHKQHQAWMEKLSAVNRDAPGSAAVPLKSIVSSINAAIVGMDEYNKNPSEAALWQVQSHLMDALLGEKLLLDTIGQA